MQTTANYGLKKPEGNDTVDIDVINGNMDAVDGQLKKLSGAMGDDPDFKTTLSNAISVKANQADFNSHVNALTAHGIGDRTQLKTAAKDTIVNALNELKTAIPSVPVQSVNGKTGSVSLGASDITVSDSSNHFSSNPKNVENVLAELFTSGTNGKNDIYNAISAKGTTPASKNFSDLVSAIGNISTGKKSASGTVITGNTISSGFMDALNNNYSYYPLQFSFSTLGFVPSIILINDTDNLPILMYLKEHVKIYGTVYFSTLLLDQKQGYLNSIFNDDCIVYSNYLNLFGKNPNTTYSFIAYE